ARVVLVRAAPVRGIFVLWRGVSLTLLEGGVVLLGGRPVLLLTVRVGSVAPARVAPPVRGVFVLWRRAFAGRVIVSVLAAFALRGRAFILRSSV
ncbi:MAG: hypothetical protein M3151_07240, partial [Actinomycetota bacterium]|nr:hypothetical protein [Actinomycetota bacterium]